MKVPATSTLTWWCAMGRLGVTLTRAGVLVVPHHVMRRRGRPTDTIPQPFAVTRLLNEATKQAADTPLQMRFLGCLLHLV